MAALGTRCSNSSEVCVRLCRKATSRAKSARSTRRSLRSKTDTGRRSRLRPLLPRPWRRPRLEPESRARRRLRGRSHRPRPRNSLQSSARVRLRLLGRPPLRRDRLRNRERLGNQGPQRCPFRARRSGPARQRREGASQPGPRRKRQSYLWGGQPQRRRPGRRPLDPNWLRQWPTSPPLHRGPAEPPLRSVRGAQRMRVCRD
jgi:hypothetical protein